LAQRRGAAALVVKICAGKHSLRKLLLAARTLSGHQASATLKNIGIVAEILVDGVTAVALYLRERRRGSAGGRRRPLVKLA